MTSLQQIPENLHREAWECLRVMYNEAMRLPHAGKAQPLPSRITWALWASAFRQLSEEDFDLVIRFWEEKMNSGKIQTR